MTWCHSSCPWRPSSSSTLALVTLPFGAAHHFELLHSGTVALFASQVSVAVAVAATTVDSSVGPTHG